MFTAYRNAVLLGLELLCFRLLCCRWVPPAMLPLGSAAPLGCGSPMGSVSAGVKCRKSCRTLLAAMLSSVNVLVTGLRDRASFLATRRFATFPTPKASLVGQMSLERECVIDNRLQICKTGGQEVGAEAMHFSGATYSRSNDI